MRDRKNSKRFRHGQENQVPSEPPSTGVLNPSKRERPNSTGSFNQNIADLSAILENACQNPDSINNEACSQQS